MFVAQLSESANTLIRDWKGGYRYGFPDFRAAEPPVRPMNYDQSQRYSGVIGRHYPNAETGRYHYLYDPNMYLQPGFSAANGTSNAGRNVVVATAAAVTIAGIAATVIVSMRARRAYREIHQRYRKG